MIKQIESILLFSYNAADLSDFYKEVVGLQLVDEMEMGEDGEEAYMFKVGNGDTGLVVLDHSKIVTKNAQPERILFNLEVDNIEEEVKRLKESGAVIIQNIYHIQDYGQIATIADTDNNWFQVVQVKES